MSTEERVLLGCGVALIVLTHLSGCAPRARAGEIAPEGPRVERPIETPAAAQAEQPRG